MSIIQDSDKIVYKGHLTLVQRPYAGRNFDVIVSKDAAAMLYIDEKDNAYLTRQFRPAIGEAVLALPAETLDKPGLNPLEVMVEGLEEECGIRISPNQVKQVGRVISTDGHDTERVYLFLAHGAGEKVSQRLEDCEKIEVVTLPFDKLYEMVINNEIEGSKTGYLVMYEKLRRLGELR
ncbi:MAG: NUDIX hydrolase [Nanoarchaeota archaeon]|nr:NUDIX hydrolase [Nanoarchaeota archaeon]